MNSEYRKAQPAPVYAWMVPVLRKVVHAHGCALGLHGSMARDLDLIAVPWTAEAVAAETLVAAVMAAVGGQFSPEDEVPDRNPCLKPHGRRAWSIYFSGLMFYIDLSVMPRVTNGIPKLQEGSDAPVNTPPPDSLVTPEKKLALELANLFGGNGKSMNESVDLVAAKLRPLLEEVSQYRYERREDALRTYDGKLTQYHRLVKAQAAYIEYLAEADKMTIGYLDAHGWHYPVEFLFKGVGLRDELAAAQAQAWVPSPPKVNPLA